MVSLPWESGLAMAGVVTGAALGTLAGGAAFRSLDVVAAAVVRLSCGAVTTLSGAVGCAGGTDLARVLGAVGARGLASGCFAGCVARGVDGCKRTARGATGPAGGEKITP